MENNNKPLPLTVARERFRKSLEDLVNSSTANGLPAFVMYDTVCDLGDELKRLTDQQYMRDLRAYEKIDEGSEQ